MDYFDLKLCTEQGFFFKRLYVGINNSNHGNLILLKYDCLIEDGAVINCWQNLLGQISDFPLLTTFLIFDLKRLKLNLRPWGTHR
jgi:hypothetical protein